MPELNDPRLPASFWARVLPDEHTGCWLWVGSRSNKEYAQWYVRGKKTRYAHRLVFEALVGPITGNLQIDHLCRVKHCVNPSHLEAVSRQENQLRGDAPYKSRKRQIDKTHCPQGHLYSKSNTLVFRGGRVCRMCKRIRTRQRHGTLATKPLRSDALDLEV